MSGSTMLIDPGVPPGLQSRGTSNVAFTSRGDCPDSSGSDQLCKICPRAMFTSHCFSRSATKSRTKSRNRGCFQDITLIKSTSSSGPSLAYSITARWVRAVYRRLRRLGHERTTGRRSAEKGEITVEFLCRAESNHAKSIPVTPVRESSCRIVCNFSK